MPVRPKYIPLRGAAYHNCRGLMLFKDKLFRSCRRLKIVSQTINGVGFRLVRHTSEALREKRCT